MIRFKDEALCCPHCGDDYLHHKEVEVFDRLEDADVGAHVIVMRGVARFDASMVGNPSSRRGGMRIRFYCESCAMRPYLVISQHKGQTLVFWEWESSGLERRASARRAQERGQHDNR